MDEAWRYRFAAPIGGEDVISSAVLFLWKANFSWLKKTLRRDDRHGLLSRRLRVLSWDFFW
jgi:hypothetical protein